MYAVTKQGEFDVERGLAKVSSGYIHYKAAGSGRPVILIHASHRSSSMYSGVIERLSDVARLYAIDLPGNGGSDALAGPPTLDGIADIVAEFADAIGAKNIVVGGHAVGAIISIKLAGKRPDLVDAVIMQSHPFYPTEEDVKLRHQKARDAYTTDSTGFPLPRSMKDVQERDLVHAPMPPTQEWLDRENVDLVIAGRRFWEYMDMVKRESHRTPESVSKVTQPVLCIWGKTFLYAERRDAIVSRLAQPEVALIPNSGLFPEIDNPHDYDEAVRSFIRKLPKR